MSGGASLSPLEYTGPVWETGSRKAFAELDSTVDCDVCVVGLGGSGLSAIAELLRAGLDVVGIDAGVVAGGAAGRNGGFLLAGLAAFYHDAARELGASRAARLYRLTLAEIEAMTARHPDAVRQTGSLRIADSEEELADCLEQLEAMTAADLPVERYAGPEGEGLLFVRDCAFDPLARCAELASDAAASGARLFERSPALSLSGSEVKTTRGSVRCGAVIVAVDGRLERLLPEASSHLRTARLQMLATAPTDEVKVHRPVYRRYGFEYYQQTADGRIALGGFRDKAGDEEWTHEATPTLGVQDRLESYLREVIGVRAPVTHRWAASVGYSRTLLPLCAELRDRVWAIGGYSGTGNVVGALLGKATAQLVAAGRSDVYDAFYAD